MQNETMDPVRDEEEPLAPTREDPATVAKTATVDGEEVAAALRTDDDGERRTIEVLATGAPANASVDGRLHFLRNVDGAEACGTCGTPWPCPDFLELERGAMHLTGQQGPPEQSSPLAVTRDEMATLMGMSRTELDQRLTQGM
jgi:hypothetical protein